MGTQYYHIIAFGGKWDHNCYYLVKYLFSFLVGNRYQALQDIERQKDHCTLFSPPHVQA